jgi:hypothetical protein
VHVATEDLGIEPERDHALLDARAAGVVDADERAADLHRQVHDLDDLLAEHLAQGTAEHREVLGEHADLSTVDRAVAGDDAVAVGAVLLLTERDRPVARELVELDERVLVQQRPDPLAGGLLALGVLLLDRLARPCMDGLVVAPDEVCQLACGRVDIRVGRCRALGEDYISHGGSLALDPCARFSTPSG